jgi:hypothetical protein
VIVLLGDLHKFCLWNFGYFGASLRGSDWLYSEGSLIWHW